MTVSVHQLVPSVVRGDATTAHTIQLRRLLREHGYCSEIYALAVHPSLEGEVELIGELTGPSRSDACVIYQYSTHSELADWLIGRRERIGLNYHNITPPALFRPYDRSIALSLSAAEVQVAQLAQVAALGICDSQFNARDLEARGFTDTVVAPILLDLEAFDAEPDPRTAASIERRRELGGTRFLCVGGIAPHKAQHDLVMALALYRRVYDPRATAVMVGRVMSAGYGRALGRLVRALGLCEAVEMPGGVSHEQLVAYYRGADVMVSVSEHEGFCVPLVEAMHHGLPVVAHRAGAVAETLGDGGLLVEDKAPGSLSAAMWRVASDQRLRERLGVAGRERVARFSLERTREEMTRALRPLLEGEG